jgi:hypothetical protein
LSTRTWRYAEHLLAELGLKPPCAHHGRERGDAEGDAGTANAVPTEMNARFGPGISEREVERVAHVRVAFNTGGSRLPPADSDRSLLRTPFPWESGN